MTISPVDISIVIPAYFGARTIADCVESVERAAVGRRRQIIVVDSSGDGTAEIVRQRFPDVTVVRSETRLTAGAARNLGVAQARGTLIFFTDQDCVVPPDWIERLERYVADGSVAAASGSVGIRNMSSSSGCAVYFLEFLYHFPGQGPAQPDANFLVGCNTVCTAAALQVVRFPDQTLGEDIIFSHDLRRNGLSLMYDPTIEVKHQNREGWQEFLSYNRKMGRAAAMYHDNLRLWWIAPFLQAPLLAFLAPAVVLPSIGLDLLRSRWSYFFRFLGLLPMCLVGNLVWAGAFRREVLDIRARASRPQDSSAP